VAKSADFQMAIDTKETVQRFLDSYRVEEQAYKGCLSLLKLADKYSVERLEQACKIALTHIPSPRYKNIRLILESGQDKSPDKSAKPDKSNDSGHAFVRGAAYYGGVNHE
jgi:hypothetical protein